MHAYTVLMHAVYDMQCFVINCIAIMSNNTIINYITLVNKSENYITTDLTKNYGLNLLHICSQSTSTENLHPCNSD